MTFTMTEAITEVRALLAESSAAFWSDTQLQSWINQGCEDVARRAEILWEQENITVVPLTAIYSFSNDFLNCHRAQFALDNSDQIYNMEYHAYNGMDEFWGILQNLPAAWPQWFTIWGNTVQGLYLRMYPVPAAAGTLTVFYYRQAVAVSGTTQIDTLTGWDDIVFDYAVFKAKRASQEASWQEAYQLYESNIAKMIDKSRSFTDLGETITTGVPQWPAYAYGDGNGMGW